MARKVDLQHLAGRRYWREAEAQVVVEAWKRSGDPLSKFVKHHGIRRGRVVRWASRLRKKSTAAPVRFFPVRLSERGASSGGAQIEIELGSLRRVRVAPGFAADDLRRVLAVLAESGRC